MSTAGPIATTIFVVTTLSVVAALVSYAVFKARGRTRKSDAPSGEGLSLSYFVEYLLPDAAAQAGTPRPTSSSRLWIWLTLLSTTVTLSLTAVVLYLLLREPPEREAQPTTPVAATPPTPTPVAAVVTVAPAAQAVTELGSAAATGAVALSPPDAGTLAAGTLAAGTRDGGPRAAAFLRGPPRDFSKLPPVKPSLFPAPRMDRNGDSKLQPDERALIHGRVPQFVLLSSEENGNVEGMVFLEQELRRRGLWGKVTFFMTGNYLPGRKSHPGGPVVEHWQRAFDENFGGLNGTTYAPGGQFWNLERWDEEVGVTQEELSLRLRLPKDWEWKTYPWGSRSPNLVITDVYFQALKRLRYPVLYDTSVVMHPAGAAAKPGLEEVRDLPWPFTLDSELPEGVEYPGLSKGATRASLRTRSIWELPAYAWYLRPPNGEPGWHPPIDQSLWQQYGCPGEGVRQPVIDDLLANLLAHYRGNRAPLLLGLKAQNYAKEETCKRETLLALLARIEELVGQGYNIRFSSMPDFILWQSALGAQ